MFLRIHPFLPDCPTCWHMLNPKIFLYSSVFLWCLLIILIHFLFHLFESSQFFLMSLVKGLSISIFSKNQLRVLFTFFLSQILMLTILLAYNFPRVGRPPPISTCASLGLQKPIDHVHRVCIYDL